VSELAPTVLLVLAAYLLGAIPFGLLIGLSRGVDVRTAGSRNIGATNVGRVLGSKWGKLCLVLDILKGLLPTVAARFVLVDFPPSQGALWRWLLVALAAVLGHVFPVYLRFRGGKGVATTIGAALGVFPYYAIAMAVALACYGIVRLSTGLVSLGSLTIAGAFPVALYVYLRWTGEPLRDFWPLQVVAILLGLLILIRHGSNIRRLLRGAEMQPTSGPADGPQATQSRS
jgi:glycerol-3-phosphate acyltransferase PlsY